MSSFYSPSQNPERVAFLHTLFPISNHILPNFQGPCTICLSDYEAHTHFATKLPCGHFFGHPCITEWLSQLNVSACPLCRTAHFPIPADEKVAREQMDILASGITEVEVDVAGNEVDSPSNEANLAVPPSIALPSIDPAITIDTSWIRQDLESIAGPNLLAWLVGKYAGEIYNAPPGPRFPFGVDGFDVGEEVRGNRARLERWVEERIRGNEEFYLECIVEEKCEEVVNALERQGRRGVGDGECG